MGMTMAVGGRFVGMETAGCGGDPRRKRTIRPSVAVQKENTTHTNRTAKSTVKATPITPKPSPMATRQNSQVLMVVLKTVRAANNTRGVVRLDNATRGVAATGPSSPGVGSRPK